MYTEGWEIGGFPESRTWYNTNLGHEGCVRIDPVGVNFMYP